jgi:hypothetical protein
MGHVIVDAIQNIGQPGLRVDAIHFRCFDQCHGAGERFATSVGPREEPVSPPNANRSQRALGSIVVYGHAAVIKE